MSTLKIKHFTGQQPYTPIWEAMQRYTSERFSQPDQFSDELWFMEHLPVFTQGQAGKAEHILNPHDIPIVQCDRGGQITYHGPGQLMIYTLFDLNRLQLNTRTFVRKLEQCVIAYLQSLQIPAEHKADAPGVYINGAKICSIGLRIRKGFSYHGLAFNIAMDLTPFSYINPCGFKNLRMTQLTHFTDKTLAEVCHKLGTLFYQAFGYHQWHFQPNHPTG
ncbi:MAG: hypothetical protein A3F10_01090 [Coxiella sp. RIFCSPHIGHO2_12_FULL_42_15]|nr:MAG: hypothetical protein A3F10_01090 [Coxiella sp. RIFCSPHIGHO2_12_FULL_42_15]